MSRLPSLSVLRDMSANDRAEVIELCARDASAEIWGLEADTIFPWNGMTKKRLLDNARRRLKRAESVAAKFGLTVT